MISRTRSFPLVLLMIASFGSSVYAEPQDIILSPCNNINTTYAATPGEAVNQDIELSASGNVFWAFTNSGGATACTAVSTTVFTCAGMTVTIPDPDVSAPPTSKVTITGNASATLGAQGVFSLTVTLESNPATTCNANYRLHVSSTGGGWGDPHITTVDGVAYDFQSAGEFTALRQDGLEIQTRQTAVPTASIPNANPYTGLATCVSIYTAAAARIGSNRVTIQPNISGQPDPSGMQLRVNGKLVELTDRGINLMSGGGGGGGSGTQDAAKVPPRVEGRIVRGAGGAIVITDARGTQLVVTPAFWQSQQKWYLNVNVYQTSAIQGIMGARAPNSWLPPLPNGTSLGQQPDSTKERYQQLYETFADAWRVTDGSSLFDYAPGTNTATFTLDEWPRYQPKSCAIQGQTSEQPTTPQAAAQACNGVTNAAQKADCIFDVTFTGHTGFAQGYEAMQRFKPNGNGWQPPLAPQEQPGKKKKWWWILLVVAAAAAIIVAASQ